MVGDVDVVFDVVGGKNRVHLDLTTEAEDRDAPKDITHRLTPPAVQTAHSGSQTAPC